jgi:hypothetical protein
VITAACSRIAGRRIIWNLTASKVLAKLLLQWHCCAIAWKEFVALGSFTFYSFTNYSNTWLHLATPVPVEWGGGGNQQMRLKWNFFLLVAASCELLWLANSMSMMLHYSTQKSRISWNTNVVTRIRSTDSINVRLFTLLQYLTSRLCFDQISK